MSQAPTPYSRQYNFLTFSQNNPNTQQPGLQLDAEYNALKVTTDSIISRLAEVQRDDGALRNGVVTRDSLSPGLIVGMNPPVPWAANTDYSTQDSVIYNGSWWWSLLNHNSGDEFVPELWQYIGTFFSEDPASFVFGRESLADGILSADTTGRLKMADEFVTSPKLDSSLRSGIAKAWANFIPTPDVKTVSMTYSGSVISATGSFAGGLTAGSTIKFSGQSGNNSVLNGAWQILSVVGSTVTFNVGVTPSGSLSAASATIIRIGASLNIKTISYIAAGRFEVTFLTSLSSSSYVLSGCAQSVATEEPTATQALGVAISSEITTSPSGFSLVHDQPGAAPNFVTFAIHGN